MTHSVPPVSPETLLEHRAWVHALARTLVRDASAADDLEQDAWVAALESPPRSVASARAWFARVVRSRAIDVFRSRTRRSAREVASARDDAAPSAADTVARAEAHRRVVEAVMALDEPYRTAILLRFFEDLPPREIARRTGVGTETARTRVRRGVDRLREVLAPPGDDRARGVLLLVAGQCAKGDAPSGPRVGTCAAAGLATALSWKTVVVGTAAAVAVAVAVVAAFVPESAPRTVVVTAVAQGDASSGGTVRDAEPRAARAASAPGGTAGATRAPQRLRFRREDGGPIAGTSVVVCTADEVSVQSKLDGGGVVEVNAATHERSALVTVPGGATLRLAVPGAAEAETRAGAAPVDLVIPAGAVVAGTVLVDGLPATSPVSLHLHLEAATVAPGAYPPILDEVFEDGGPDIRGAHTRSAAGGEFRFVGCPTELTRG